MPETSEIECLRHRLTEWARWNASYRPKLGYPHAVNFMTLMTPNLVHDGDGSYEKIDLWTMQTIDSAINSLIPVYSNAIYARYLGNREHPLADDAEQQLMPIVVSRGLLLI